MGDLFLHSFFLQVMMIFCHLGAAVVKQLLLCLPVKHQYVKTGLKISLFCLSRIYWVLLNMYTGK